VTSLHRALNIEMESLDSIRMKVIEDVRLKIYVSASWAGLYRRAGPAMRASSQNIGMYTDAVYDSSLGRFCFHPNGEYELGTSNSLIKGRYVFFRVGDRNLLELRPESAGLRNENSDARLVYVLANVGRANNRQSNLSGNISLTRVRLGVAGFQELHENQIILTRAQ
jgi:hypothetical protein